MYEKIVKIISDYVYNNKEIDSDYYYEVYSILEEYYRLDKFMKGLFVDDYKMDVDSDAVYLPNKKKIIAFAYPSRSIKKLLDLSDDKVIGYSKNYMRALITVDTLIHEINHAILFHEIETGRRELIHELVLKSTHVVKYKDFNNIFDYFINQKLSQKVYDNYHDLSPTEINGQFITDYELEDFIKALDTLDYSRVTLEQFKAFKDISTFTALKKKYHLNLRGNITNSPSYDYCNMVRNKDKYKPEVVLEYNEDNFSTFKKDKEKYNLKERLAYGLQLTNNELLTYVDTIKEKVDKEAKYIRRYVRK